MKKKILILVVLFLFLIVMFAPIKLAENFIPENSSINISGMQGSIWSGTIDNIEIKEWIAKDVDYHISAISLLSGTLGGSGVIRKGDVKGELSFEIADQNNLEISDANIEISAFNFEKYISFPGIELNGKILTQDFFLHLVEKKPVTMSGITSWKNASVNLNGKKWQLGDFNISWTTKSDKELIVGIINKNLKNKLDIEGNINITKLGMLEYKGSIAASAEKAIFSAFSLFANGKVQNGRLPIKFKKKIF